MFLHPVIAAVTSSYLDKNDAELLIMMRELAGEIKDSYYVKGISYTNGLICSLKDKPSIEGRVSDRVKKHNGSFIGVFKALEQMNINDLHYKLWHKDDMLHREDGPAVLVVNDLNCTILEAWYQYGSKHREDGPAYIFNGYFSCWYRAKEWWVDGRLHRKDGPAIDSIEWSYDDESNSFIQIYRFRKWYQDGKLHREDGPAIIAWDKQEFPPTVDSIKEWYIDGKRHRLDGPAIEHKNNKKWYKNNRLHCDSGPAVVIDGHREWWYEGKRHNEGAPAILYANGAEEYWLKGRFEGRFAIVKGRKCFIPTGSYQ